MPCGHLSAERPSAPACWPASVSSASWTPTTRATRLITRKQTTGQQRRSSVPHQLLLPVRQSIEKLLLHKNVARPIFFKFSRTDLEKKNVVPFSYSSLSMVELFICLILKFRHGQRFRCKNRIMNEIVIVQSKCWGGGNSNKKLGGEKLKNSFHLYTHKRAQKKNQETIEARAHEYRIRK